MVRKKSVLVPYVLNLHCTFCLVFPQVEKSGLLSKLEASGLTLSKIEELQVRDGGSAALATLFRAFLLRFRSVIFSSTRT